MAYIGKQPVVGNFQKCDAISVVNGQAAYTMQVGGVNVNPESENHMLVSLNGVLQAPVDSFTISGSTITFASNLATGDVIDFIMLLGNVLDLGTPSDNTVSLAKLTASGTKDATTFLRGDNSFAVPSGGKILQVLQTAKTDTFTLSTTNTWTDVTGLSQAITPASTSNKVLVNFSIGITSNAGANSHGFKIVRGSTSIGIGDAASSRTQTTVWDYPSENHAETQSFTFLDSPSTTSATTYKIQMYANDTAYVNRMSTDSDSDTYGRGASTITLMEVAG